MFIECEKLKERKSANCLVSSSKWLCFCFGQYRRAACDMHGCKNEEYMFEIFIIYGDYGNGISYSHFQRTGKSI